MQKNKNSFHFIFIIGGVISGLGKGIFTASLGKVLQMAGYKVNLIKIDPYLNVDAGTMRPTEHGEVWVTYDGGEIDQDLGNYERFLHIKFSKNNNITSGKVLQTLINAERTGEFLGKTVQYIPHATNKIQGILQQLHKQSGADISIVEIGGTVGDYESSLFLHSIARIQTTIPISTVFMGYLLKPPHLGELKTKPFQHALSALFSYGIKPNAIVLRAPDKIDEPRKQKIATVANVKINSLIELPDSKNIYTIVKRLYSQNQNAIKNLLKPLNLEFPKFKQQFNTSTPKYNLLLQKINKINKQKTALDVAIVGKYIKTGDFILKDTYISVLEALKFASWANNVKINIEWINSLDLEDKNTNLKDIFANIKAVIVPGGFGKTGVEGKIKAIKYARENKIPYLGLCYGLQLATIEFARNITKLKNANSTEIDPNTPHPVIDILPEQKNVIKNNQYGGTMRLGEYKAYIKPNTIVFNVYKKLNRISQDKYGYYVIERHRHRYEVNPKYHNILQKHGLVFSGMSQDKKLVEFIELPSTKHPYFVGTQAHPEFTSYINDPNPLFWGLIKHAKGLT